MKLSTTRLIKATDNKASKLGLLYTYMKKQESLSKGFTNDKDTLTFLRVTLRYVNKIISEVGGIALNTTLSMRMDNDTALTDALTRLEDNKRAIYPILERLRAKAGALTPKQNIEESTGFPARLPALDVATHLVQEAIHSPGEKTMFSSGQGVSLDVLTQDFKNPLHVDQSEESVVEVLPETRKIALLSPGRRPQTVRQDVENPGSSDTTFTFPEPAMVVELATIHAQKHETTVVSDEEFDDHSATEESQSVQSLNDVEIVLVPSPTVGDSAQPLDSNLQAPLVDVATLKEEMLSPSSPRPSVFNVEGVDLTVLEEVTAFTKAKLDLQAQLSTADPAVKPLVQDFVDYIEGLNNPDNAVDDKEIQDLTQAMNLTTQLLAGNLDVNVYKNEAKNTMQGHASTPLKIIGGLMLAIGLAVSGLLLAMTGVGAVALAAPTVAAVATVITPTVVGIGASSFFFSDSRQRAGSVSDRACKIAYAYKNAQPLKRDEVDFEQAPEVSAACCNSM